MAELTAKEARVLAIARDGIEIIRQAEKNPNFCVGSAWKTLELILAEFGETVPPPPWREDQEAGK